MDSVLHLKSLCMKTNVKKPFKKKRRINIMTGIMIKARKKYNSPTTLSNYFIPQVQKPNHFPSSAFQED